MACTARLGPGSTTLPQSPDVQVTLRYQFWLRSILTPIWTPSTAHRKKQSPPSPRPVRWRVTSNRWILKFTRALGRVQASVFRRCLIVLHLCTASPRRLGVGVFTACSTPVESQKRFTTRQLNASFHAQEEGICCKPSLPLPFFKECTVCLKSSPLTSDKYWRVGFSLDFHPSLPLPVLSLVWGIFFDCYSCCSLEAGRRKPFFSPRQGAHEASETQH